MIQSENIFAAAEEKLVKFKPTASFSQDASVVVSCADSLITCKDLPSETFQLIVSSPPYNLGKVYEKQTSLDNYLEWQAKIITELIRLLSPQGSLVWQVGNFVDRGEVFPLDIYFYPLFKEHGLKLRNRIVWHFDHGLHASKRFSGRYETLLWFTKTDNYVFNLDSVRVPSKYPGKRHYKGDKIGQLSGNPLGKNPSDFWQIIQHEWETGIIDIPNVKSNHPEKTQHPCQFPVELVERCVLAMTNEHDWVLDPFGGVGSSLIAALKWQRRGMSIDQNVEYCQTTLDRVKSLAAGELKLRPLGRPIHKPTGCEKVAKFPIEWEEQ
ncbi:MAG: DNA-methyltransferase [Thermoguttaceae bacterium]